MKCIPVIIDSLDGHIEYLERIESQPYDEKTEAWLQNVIFNHPRILPVEEFDESFSPLVPLGREVVTPRGNIDILFVSPFGKLILVETKLWKNPEKHRTVVVQLIDYAKEVSRWNYDELSNAVLNASRTAGTGKKKYLDKIVEPILGNSGISLDVFQERMIRNLDGGEFLLLIIGDKISPNVSLLSESIHGSPGLNFSFGLIELQLHQLNKNEDWPLLVLPDIVGRTVEETRGVVLVEYKKEKPKIEVKVTDEKPKGKTTQKIFLQKAPDDLASVYERWLETWKTRKDTKVYWGISGFSFRVKIKGKFETVLDAYPEWAVSLIRSVDAERCRASDDQYQKYLDAINSVSAALDLFGSDKKYISHDSLSPEDLEIIINATNDFADEVKSLV